MESLEYLQKQLDGLRDLRDIVKTMKALSAASIRQYEHAAEALAEYYRTVELGLHAAVRGVGVAAVAELNPRRGSATPGMIVFGSDHGLCGRFNDPMPSLMHASTARGSSGAGHSPSITYRIAVYPQAGRKAFTLQTAPAREQDIDHPNLAKTAGFSLHAGVAAKAHQRRKLERLCRYVARPAVATDDDDDDDGEAA